MNIRLEPQTVSHAVSLFEALSDRRIYEFLDDAPPQSAEQVEQRIARQSLGPQDDSGDVWKNWIVLVDDVVVGKTQATIRSSGEAVLAYILSPAVWGKSVAYLACLKTIELLIAHGGVRALVADTEVDNLRSQRLLSRLGFHETSRSDRDIFFRLDLPDREV